MRRAELRDTLKQIARLASEAAVQAGDDSAGTAGPGDEAPQGAVDHDAFSPRDEEEACEAAEAETHTFGGATICATDDRGQATPRNRSPLELVVDATDGFVPLWAQGVTLRWKFNERSMQYFRRPEAAKNALRGVFRQAVWAWGEAAPVRFRELRDAWDFEIVMSPRDNCSPRGCVLASAFFPDAGRHQLLIYPEMLGQSPKERLDTLIHEIGHVFGLRHFFAQITETRWASEIFGKHRPFSIMNYGHQSELTEDDKTDLTRLYQETWNRRLTNVNGTPIRLFQPFHESGVRF